MNKGGPRPKFSRSWVREREITRFWALKPLSPDPRGAFPRGRSTATPAEHKYPPTNKTNSAITAHCCPRCFLASPPPLGLHAHARTRPRTALACARCTHAPLTTSLTSRSRHLATAVYGTSGCGDAAMRGGGRRRGAEGMMKGSQATVRGLRSARSPILAPPQRDDAPILIWRDGVQAELCLLSAATEAATEVHRPAPPRARLHSPLSTLHSAALRRQRSADGSVR